MKSKGKVLKQRLGKLEREKKTNIILLNDVSFQDVRRAGVHKKETTHTTPSGRVTI